MPFDKFDLDATTEERVKSIKKTIRSINVEEVKKMGDNLFQYADDPWRDAFFRFVAEHPNATFYHALTHENVNILYNTDSGKGIWFLPGSGLGPLQDRGKKVMNDASQSAR